MYKPTFGCAKTFAVLLLLSCATLVGGQCQPGPPPGSFFLIPDGNSSTPKSPSYFISSKKGSSGLLYRFQCVDQNFHLCPVSNCFPLSETVPLTASITTGGSFTACPAAAPSSVSCTPPIQCPVGSTVGSTACPLAPPCPAGSTVGGTGCPLPQKCTYSIEVGPTGLKDTVRMVTFDTFPNPPSTVQYSVTGAQNVAGNAVESGQNVLSFCTANPTQGASLELVFDVSGSMALPAVPGGSTTRLQALRQAVVVLSGILKAYAISGDKIGVVFFSKSAEPLPDPDVSTTPPTPACTGTNLIPATPANVDAVNGQIQAAPLKSTTSIGAGLKSADKCGLSTEPAAQAKGILLFSDGEKNTFEDVGFSSQDRLQLSDLNGTNFTDFPIDISVCPITAGLAMMTAPGYALQQHIAHVSCADHNATVRNTSETFTVGDLETFFAQSLARILPSDKLEIVTDRLGTVSRGGTAVEKFLGNANDVSTTIVLSLLGGTEGDRILPFQLQAPDGTIVDLSTKVTIAGHSSFTTLSFPVYQSELQVNHKGQWQLTIGGRDLHSSSVNYHLLVMSDNPTIVSDFQADARDLGTGDPIPIRVKLMDRNTPVLNATVEAQLIGPQNSQGNVLSSTPTPTIASGGNDPASTKGQAKLDALYKDPANASLFATRNFPTITLTDSGHVGTYAGSFGETTKEGHYYFVVRLRGTSLSGDFERAYLLNVFVRPKPDADNTVFKILSSSKQSTGNVLVKLQAIPHDRFGNFLGPGYEKDMQITSTAGTIEKPLDDKLDGSYEITYRLPSAATNPDFTIKIMGSSVMTKSLSDLRHTNRLGAFLDLGPNFPHGSFGSVFNTGVSLNAGLEYIANPHFSVEGVFGYHHFPSSLGASLNTYQFSANGKTYLTTGAFRPFVNGGIGGYKFSPGSTYFGGNVGGGLLYTLTPKFGLQLSYNLHVVNTGPATKFSDVQFGVRWVF